MSPHSFPLVVHATQEAGVKLGGIGAVLDGLLGSPAYNEAVGRSILVGPINTWNIIEKERLTASGNRLRTIYSSLPGFEWNDSARSGGHGAARNRAAHERPLPLRGARLWPL